ncbi:MAG: hypothetical protein LBI87_08475 [Candidatus Accumulibacter sp.]|jgi:hypothetical protein|nr:hypothetical protein [Accumulibacter sp.]
MNDRHKDGHVPQVYQQRSRVARVIDKIAGLYDPIPMTKPEVDKNFEKMGAIEQITESLSYNASAFLYAISPEGGLQAWWKMMIRLTLFCLPVGIFFMLATFTLAWGTGYLEAATRAIQHAMESIALTVLYAVATAFFISSVVIFVKSKFFSPLSLIFAVIFCVFLGISIVKAIPEMVTMGIKNYFSNFLR